MDWRNYHISSIFCGRPGVDRKNQKCSGETSKNSNRRIRGFGHGN